MTRTIITPDIRREITELQRRIGALERRINPVAGATDDNHAGTGANAVLVTLTGDTSIGAAGDSSVAVGWATEAGQNSVAVGTGAGAVPPSSVAIGGGDVGTGAGTGVGAISVGGAYPNGDGVIAMGWSADAHESTVGEKGAIAVGEDAYAINSGVAVGWDTSAIKNGVAVGYSADAAHEGAVALGSSVTTTGTHQVNTSIKPIFVGCPGTNPSNALLIPRQVTFWVDEAANLLNFKVKYSNNAVKSGTVALT